MTPDCKHLLDNGITENGVYLIAPPGSPKPFEVYCDMADGGWTVIQRRVDKTVDFDRGMADYVAGFGDPTGNFWAGLDNIHYLTSYAHTELAITMTFVILDLQPVFQAKYSTFNVGNNRGYQLVVDGFTGNATDSFSHLSERFFSTRDNNVYEMPFNCAREFHSGWWYGPQCDSASTKVDLNAPYYSNTFGPACIGMANIGWTPYNCLIAVTMKVRRPHVTDVSIDVPRPWADIHDIGGI